MRLLNTFQEEMRRKEVADTDAAGGVPVLEGADIFPLRLPSNQEMKSPEMAHGNNANALITSSWLELLHELGGSEATML